MTYSVLDKFGERLCEGTRGYCEEMVLRMKWREVIITRYVKKYIPKKKIITTNVFKNFKTSKNNYKQQIVAIFEDGHREVFETVEQVASRFNVVVGTVYRAIYRGRQAYDGKLKGVKLEYKKGD